MSDPLDELFSLPMSGKEWDLPTARMLVALTMQRVKTLETDLENVKTDLKDNYALKTAITALADRVRLPIHMVYSTAGVILIAVLAALICLVVKGHPGT